MVDKEKLVRFYKGTDGEEVVIKLLNNIEAVQKNQKYRVTDFLDPFGQEIAETVAAHYKDIKVEFYGGYIGAERQCACFIHDNYLGNTLYNLGCIEAKWNDKFYRISHRDILGSLMGLGIKRELIGDLLISLGKVKIICSDKIETFVLDNLLKIGSASVINEIVALDTIEPKEERCKEITSTVASLRLDSVAATGFGTSRSKMVSIIEADKLKLNWQSIKSSSQTVKVGDIISSRGRGRIEVAEIKGTTKKGRTVVVLKRYI